MVKNKGDIKRVTRCFYCTKGNKPRGSSGKAGSLRKPPSKGETKTQMRCFSPIVTPPSTTEVAEKGVCLSMASLQTPGNSEERRISATGGQVNWVPFLLVRFLSGKQRK
jgi:hypothetical protein